MERELKEEKIFRRTAKDSVFTHLFSEPKYLLELYKTLHPEDTEATEDDIKDVTIRNIITDNMYNDLGFRVGNKLLILVEAQSTWSPNILIRELLYLMQTYNNYFTENDVDLYASIKVKLPKPELYVIYTGERKEKNDYISLKEEFFQNEKEVLLEARAKVFYDGTKRDIIGQYVAFAKVCNDQVKKYGYTREAIKETLRICIDSNVLAEYLTTREVEIMDIMTALFDEDEIARRYYDRVKQASWQKGQAEGWQKGQAEGWQKGQAEGWQKGQAEGWQKGASSKALLLAKKYMATGHSAEEAADFAEIDVSLLL